MSNAVELYINKHAEGLHPDMENARLSLIEQQTNAVIEALSQKQALVLDFYDNTRQAGPHIVRIFDDPQHSQALVQIPDSGASYPTALHGLEYLVWSRRIAAGKGIDIPTPEVHFAEKQTIAKARRALRESGRSALHTVIPLNVHPDQAQLLIFNSQARSTHIDPTSIAYSYYHHIRNGGGFNEWPFHTMLVTHAPGEPRDKTITVFRRGEHSTLRTQGYKLLNHQRVDISKMRSR